MKQICLKKNNTYSSITSFAAKAMIAPLFLLLFSNNGFSQGSKDSVLLND